MQQTSNPSLYRALSIPFPNRVEADAAMEGFQDELSALREKYKLPDVVVVVQANVMTEQGEGLIESIGSFGDPVRRVTMLARALGREQAEQADYLARVLKAAKCGA